MGRDPNTGREGSKNGSPQGDSNLSKRTFFFPFSMFLEYCHRLNYCIIGISFAFVLLKSDYYITSGFPRVLVAAQLLAVTSQLAAKLRFVDYGSILELNSSVNTPVEYHD